MKETTKYQLERDGELFGKVYDKKYEAEAEGLQLVACNWIASFIVVPVKAVWLKVK